ncbi:hypothetical protein O181_053295 [Austropuccinia psidii MF-1]|uniref:Uncharacterized protein n=1 Tax=Austropuccinia psidii MF-1 TaxID=1389203 RepID=A0A9Q3HTE2_9BASI|nr:hypothetical protein [Austropuccinia psidii MF-1]
MPSMIFNSKGYPSTSSLIISPPSASNTTNCDFSDSNTSETQSSFNPEPHPLTTESITNSLISSAKHHKLSMSTDELDLSRNPCVLDPYLIPACPSWEQFLESTYPTQPPSLNENQTYLTTSTNKPPIFNVEKVQLTQEEFLLSMEKKFKRLKKMI